MRHAQKLIALLLAVTLICGVCLAVTGTTVQDTGTADASSTAQLLTLSTVFTFSDVPADTWYADAVAYVSSAGIMGGTTATTFSPDEVMTRAMLVTVLYRLAGRPAVSGTDTFADTALDGWYSDAVLWAYQKGVVSGYENGLFGTNDPVSREQFAAILWKYAGCPTAESGTDYADESTIASYAAEAVDWARAYGIINGKDGNLFDPHGIATRAQTAVILMNYIQSSKELPTDTGTGEPHSGNVIGALKNVPAAYTQPAEEQGQIVRLNYTAASYTNPGQTLEKYALVYLPYGFDAADTQTRYNVLYLLHGGGGSARSYFGGEDQSNDFKCILDNLIQNGELEPMLIVTPSFYPTESTDSSIPTAADAVKQFPRELVNDLIPAVEGTYPTYAKTTDTTGLQSSRDHRGFGGFSMGSVATWYVFTDCLDYFRYYLPLSGDSWIFGQYGGSSNPEGTAAALSQALENSGYGQNDFFIHAMTGTSDIAYTALSPQIAAMQETTDFIFDPDTSVGNLYFTVQEGGTHDYAHIYGYLYNALPVFWGG